MSVSDTLFSGSRLKRFLPSHMKPPPSPSFDSSQEAALVCVIVCCPPVSYLGPFALSDALVVRAQRLIVCAPIAFDCTVFPLSAG
jgi:hypothetical protein